MTLHSARFGPGSFVFSKRRQPWYPLGCPLKQKRPSLPRDAELHAGPGQDTQLPVVQLLLKARAVYGKLSGEHAVQWFLWSLGFIPEPNLSLQSPTQQQLCGFYLRRHFQVWPNFLPPSYLLASSLTYMGLPSLLFPLSQALVNDASEWPASYNGSSIFKGQ